MGASKMMRGVATFGAVAGMLVATAARADQQLAEGERQSLSLATTGGATYSGDVVFLLGEIDLRRQFSNHTRAALALQAAGHSSSLSGCGIMPGMGGGATPTKPCWASSYFASYASVQYDVTRARDSNLWFGLSAGVPLLVVGDVSSGVIGALEMTIDRSRDIGAAVIP